MLCAIWYHLYNLTAMKNTHGGVLLLVKLQALARRLQLATLLKLALLRIFHDFEIAQVVSNCATHHK